MSSFCLFDEWVDDGKGEGLVIRPEHGRIFKLKPMFTLDAVVIGFTEKTEEPRHVRSLLLALIHESGQFQLIGSVDNLGCESLRADLYRRLSEAVTESSYQFAGSSGVLYRFVHPQLVVEVKVTDLQVEDTSGRAVRRMVLEHDPEQGWTPVRQKPGVSLTHPALSRVRDDKRVNSTDVHASQILERCELEELDQAVARIQLPKSEVLRRDVFCKTLKEKVSVRKLVIWRTHKEDIDPLFPPYVVHWTDFSPGRKAPIQREIRLAPDEATAMGLGDEMVINGVKKGWVKMEQ